ncbi:toll/interleukin-1 receptor domain-containing protein [Actinophytocola sp.]|uniref:toll/interleukin-1 receptor domain-containing protein n=1 Tax=Actinophytocola sp. TaxID=1872138 RepID=UPI002ED817C6
MVVSRGFLSYAHRDNDAEGNRIRELAGDIEAQYELLTGEPARLFVEREHLRWGEDWKLTIDEALAQATFFIPVVTPTYFRRTECRRELDMFARRAVELGVKDLVLPLLYVDFDDLHADPCEDDLVALVRKFGWENWTSLRFAERRSGDYRRAVAGLAGRLASASAAAEWVQVPESGLDELDDAPGYLDILARTEEAVPAWRETVAALDAALRDVGMFMQVAVEQQPPTPDFGDRIAFARRLAGALEGPVGDLQAKANDFLGQLHAVDQGVRIVVERAEREVAEHPEIRDHVLGMTRLLRQFVDGAPPGLADADDLSTVAESIERLSRNLRPVVRNLRKALTLLIDGRDVLASWATLLDRLPPHLDGRDR